MKQQIKGILIILGVVLGLVLIFKAQNWWEDRKDYMSPSERRKIEKQLRQTQDSLEAVIVQRNRISAEYEAFKARSNRRILELQQSKPEAYENYLQDITRSPDATIDDRIQELGTRLSRQDSIRERHYNRHHGGDTGSD